VEEDRNGEKVKRHEERGFDDFLAEDENGC
jgi:hypothetical protein